MARLSSFDRALDANGNPVSGAKRLVYIADTTTGVTTYSDENLTTAHASPQIADGNGYFADAYIGDGYYKVRVNDASDNLLQEADWVEVGYGQGAGSLYRATITGNGTTGPYALPTTPAVDALVSVSLGGVDQIPTDYTISGATITFTDRVPYGVKGEVIVARKVAAPVVDNAQYVLNPDTGNTVAEDIAILSNVFASRAAAIAASVPAAVQRIGVITERKDTIWFKRNATGVALTTGDGAKWDPEGNTASPAHFGAADNGTGDWATELNAWRAFGVNSWDAAKNAFGYVLDGRNGTFRTETSVGFPEVRQPGLMVQNITIIGATGTNSPNSAIVDCHGWNEPRLRNVYVWGESGGGSFVGLAIGRGLNGAIAPNAILDGVEVDGYFIGAGFLDYASEVGSFPGFTVRNRNRESGRNALFVDNLQTVADQIGTYTSQHTTLPSAATNNSNLQHVIRGARFEAHSDLYLTLTGITNANPAVVSFTPASLTLPLANGDKVFVKASGMASVDHITHTVANLDTGAGTFELSGIDTTSDGAFSSGDMRYATCGGIVLAGTKRLDMSGYVLVYNSTLAAVTIDTKNGGVLTDVEIDLQIESNPAIPIKWIRDASGTEVMQEVHIRLTQQGQSTATNIVHSDGAGDIRIDGFSLDISNMSVAPTADIFDAPGDFFLREARIESPLAAALHYPTQFGLYSGRMVAYDRAPRGIDYFPAQTWTAGVYDASSGGNAGTATNLSGQFVTSGGMCTAWVKLVNIDTTGMTGANDLYIDFSDLWSKLGLAGAPAITGAYNFFVGPVLTSQVTNPSPLTVELQEGVNRGRIAESQPGGGATDYLIVSEVATGAGDISIQLQFALT